MSQEVRAPGLWSSHYGDLTLAALSRVPVIVVADNSAERFACARFIHNMGALKLQPFVAVTCDSRADADHSWSGVAHARNGSPLRGWLAQARTGTLFIDSVDQMPASIQEQLSEILDHSLVPGDNPLSDVRLITGAGADWAGGADSRRFSERLYYRLNIMRVHYARPRPISTTSAYREFGVPQLQTPVGVSRRGSVPPVHA